MLTSYSVIEHKELATIYVKRGLDIELAKEVSSQPMAYDAHGRISLSSAILGEV